MTSRSLQLANGLTCRLYHQPDARQAAALISVEAGSLNEDDEWPGLAHLMEHLLFCGSEGFSAREGLMSWVPAQGGQLNATTRLNRSAFFFQVPPPTLEAGLHRLCDMLASPSLSLQAIQQEITVIEAEYRLLQNHPETLSHAALFEKLPPHYQRFRVGSRAAFGDNLEELQTALRRYHRRFYLASGMTLWLQGPQPIDELELLAAHYGALLPKGSKAPAANYFPAPTEDRLLQLDAEEGFWLTLMLEGDEPLLRSHVALLNAFCLDEAPGGLMEHLREETLCESLAVEWLWQDAHHGWLALCFSGPKITPEMTRRIESLFWRYLSQIGVSSLNILSHYARLAQEDFAALSPLAQLQGRALSFAPASFPPEHVKDFLVSIPHQPHSRLLTQRNLPGETHLSQGFKLRSQPWTPAAAALPAAVAFTFNSPLATAQSLQTCVETLLLRPTFYQAYDEAGALTRLRALRPILAALRHAGGRGRWHKVDGVWQLELGLPVVPQAEAMSCLRQAVEVLRAEISPQLADNPPDVAIRKLLHDLPGQLLQADGKPEWLAAWCGENIQLQKWAAPLLTSFAAPSPRPACSPQLRRGITHAGGGGEDSALLLFIPLPQRDDASLAALRALALLMEPLFFDRLRVKQQIGYVVSARYQRVVDVDGLQLALQSPTTPWRRLLGHCKRFLREMHNELCSQSITDILPLQTALRECCSPGGNVAIATQRLRQQQGLPCLTPTAIAGLEPEQIERLLLQSLRQRRRWRILVTGP